MTLAVGGGAGVGWFGFLLAVSAMFTAAKLLAVLGKNPPRLPLMLTSSTKAGEVAVLLVVYSAFTLFFLVGLLLAL